MVLDQRRQYGCDILFVCSPSNALEPYMPLYFLYLAGYLERNGFKVGIVDPHQKNIRQNVKIILHEIKEKRPRYVGLAAFVTDYDVIVDLAKEIKKETGSKIIVGNAHASIEPRDFLYKNSPFDLVVRGEGELTLRQVLEEYDENMDNSNIKGIAFLRDGSIKINDNREFMDLNECGMPAYHMIDMKWYAKPTKLIIRRLIASAAVIYTSRGCPYNCVFCASNTVWNSMCKSETGQAKTRKRPLSHVMEDLHILQDKYHFEFFYIIDDTFGMTEQEIIEFCDAYAKSGLKMLWAAETRVNCIKNESIVRMMKAAGCLQLDFGVETGSSKLLEIVDKKITIQQTVNAFNLCKKGGIRTFANMLINLPEETEEDLALSHRLLAQIKPTYISVGVTQPYPGTVLYDKYLKAPISKEEYCKLSRLIPPEEFRVSRHTINLNILLKKWQKRYGINTPLETNIFKADLRYWAAILRSTKKPAYFLCFIVELIKEPIKWLLKQLFYSLNSLYYANKNAGGIK